MLLFNLPANILSNIYEYDPTYHDIFKNKILFEIWKRSFVQYKYNLLSNKFFITKPNLRKIIKTLLEYLFEDETATWFKYHWYDNPTDKKPMTNDIRISCRWHIYTFSIINNKLFTNMWHDTNIDVYEENIFEVNVGLKYYPYINNTERYHSFKGIIVSKLHSKNRPNAGTVMTGTEPYFGNQRFPFVPFHTFNSAQYLYKYSNDEYTVMHDIKPPSPIELSPILYGTAIYV